MKRLTLLIAAALFFCATATFAQDTTRTRKQGEQQQSDQLRDRESDDMKGYTKVNSSDVPSSLRTTLSSGTMYKGWDDATNGGVYKNANGQYLVKVGQGTSKKTYHFDKDGKPISKPQD